jgi:hypothetical protein
MSQESPLVFFLIFGVNGKTICGTFQFLSNSSKL